MTDFILFIALIFGVYLCSLTFVVAMLSVFFPLRTKEEWEKLKALRTASSHQRIARMNRAARAAVDSSRQLA